MTRLAVLRILWLALALTTLILLLLDGSWITFVTTLIAWSGGIVTALLAPSLRATMEQRRAWRLRRR